MSPVGQQQTSQPEMRLPFFSRERTSPAGTVTSAKCLPVTDILLFHDCIGTGEHCGRYCEAQCPSGFNIDRQLVRDRRLHRQDCGLLALEDAMDIARGAPRPLRQITYIKYQPPTSNTPPRKLN